MNQLGQPSPAERASKIGPMLSAAGFRMLPADNQKKLDQLKNLPQLVLKYVPAKEGGNQYWMADATYCRCLYVGDDGAYQAYEDIKLQQGYAELQQTQAAQQQQRMMMSPFMFGGGPTFVFH